MSCRCGNGLGGLNLQSVLKEAGKLSIGQHHGAVRRLARHLSKSFMPSGILQAVYRSHAGAQCSCPLAGVELHAELAVDSSEGGA